MPTVHCVVKNGAARRSCSVDAALAVFLLAAVAVCRWFGMAGRTIAWGSIEVEELFCCARKHFFMRANASGSSFLSDELVLIDWNKRTDGLSKLKIMENFVIIRNNIEYWVGFLTFKNDEYNYIHSEQ